VDKIIFQIALLGFFIATVIFCMQSMPLLEVIVNALVVGISIMFLSIIIVGISRYLFLEKIQGNPFKTNNNNGVSGTYVNNIATKNAVRKEETPETVYLFRTGKKRFEPLVDPLSNKYEPGVVDWVIAEKRTIILKINRR